MSYVVTLQDFTPGARYDGNPWTQARIEESRASAGPWTTVQTLTLSPADADPSVPAARNLTTALATLEEGWYRVVWIDAAGHTQPTDAVYSAVPSIRDRLRSMVAANEEPTLTDAELDQLVQGSRRADTLGIGPSEDGWTATYDLNSAAAEGWRWKAAKVAAAYDFTLDNEQSFRSQMYANCIAQAAVYAKGIATTVRTSPYDPAHPELWPIYP